MTNVPPGQRFVPPSMRQETSTVVDKSLPGIHDSHGPKPGHFPNNPISLEIHMRETRERTAGMTPEERAWRKKWVMDQKLAEFEPIMDHPLRPLNPIRKLYRMPWDWLEVNVLNKMFGWWFAFQIRQTVPKLLIGFALLEVSWYCIKYNRASWDFYRGWHAVSRGRPQFFNEEKIEAKYPGLIAKTLIEPQDGRDFWDLGFRARKGFRDLGPPERP